MMTEVVLYEKLVGGIVVVTLNRPEKRNGETVSIAAAVHEGTGAPIAIIVLTAPQPRLRPAQRVVMGRKVSEAVQSLSRTQAGPVLAKGKCFSSATLAPRPLIRSGAPTDLLPNCRLLCSIPAATPRSTMPTAAVSTGHRSATLSGGEITVVEKLAAPLEVSTGQLID